LVNKEYQFLKTPLDGSTYNNTTVNKTNKKAAGDTIWSEDFTNGFPAGWSSVDNTGNGYVWVNHPAGILPDADFTTNISSIKSNSGGNCMLLYSDLYQSHQPAGGYIDMDAYFQTTAIPINGQPDVNVNFQQYFRRCCSNSWVTAFLMANTDPTFTSNVFTYDITGAISPAASSPNPVYMSINISDIAGGLNGDIYLRFYIGSGVEAYFWMIDDIYITEAPVNEIEVSNGFYGFDSYQYTRIPSSQIQPMDFSIQSINNGSADQTGTNFTADINNGTSSIFNGNSNDTTINSLSTDTFNLNDFWTPPFSPPNQPYTISLDVFSDSIDETPANNSISFPPLQTTIDKWAHDDFSNTPGNGEGNAGPNGVNEYEAGNYYKTVNYFRPIWFKYSNRI